MFDSGQEFTQKERDLETGLDYFGGRSTQAPRHNDGWFGVIAKTFHVFHNPKVHLILAHTHRLVFFFQLCAGLRDGSLALHLLSYTQSFGYDELNRLTTSSESTGGWSQTNKYDRYGNRAIDLGGGNQSLYFNSANQITNAGYSYDGRGNLTTDGLNSYGYDAENKIKSDNETSDVYRYDGDGNRIRKNFTSGDKLRMVYSGGQLVAEYDLTNGSLKKEYVYGAKGLIATIEPGTATLYATSDHLGSPRVITNASGGVVSRHDYMPFGEELCSGVGGRTIGMGFCVGDGMRHKCTSHERDTETGLDYMKARYYQGLQGRFISADPLLASGENRRPQSWNRYSYVLNNPLRLLDPTGLVDVEATEEEMAKQVVKPLEDKVIEKRLTEIRSTAKPLSPGEISKPTSVEVIKGEQIKLDNAIVQTPTTQFDVPYGYMQTIALVVLDQGKNIMVNPDLSVTEYVTPAADSPDAKLLYDANKSDTTNGVQIEQQANGAFYDLQIRGLDPSKRAMDVKTNQDVVVKSQNTNVFMVQRNQIRMDDAKRNITFTLGAVRKFGN